MLSSGIPFRRQVEVPCFLCVTNLVPHYDSYCEKIVFTRHEAIYMVTKKIFIFRHAASVSGATYQLERKIYIYL